MSPAAAANRVWMLAHNRVRLALHELRAGGHGHPLLLLHGLGEAAPSSLPDQLAAWPGGIYALDFTGHGASTIPRGGGYTAEILLADADHAVTALTDGTVDIPATRVTVVGRGLGAYVALQLAGARPDLVHGAVLLDGPGLAGGPTGPTSNSFFTLAPSPSTPDHYALVELGRDLRPPDYAATFVRLALAGSALEFPIVVATMFRPPWVEEVARELGVADVGLADALAMYGTTTV